MKIAMMKLKAALFAVVAMMCLPKAVLLAQETTLEEPVVEMQVFELRDGSEMQAELWKIKVPQNRQAEDSDQISVAVMRIESPRKDKGDPVFFLAGGPGGSSIEIVKQMVSGGGDQFFELIGGDIVAIDQRGVGLSEPNLSTDVLYGHSVSQPGGSSKNHETTMAVIKKEAQRLRKEGVELSGFNTRESADDIEHVRVQLGYEKIVLWGSSYGTHLAMATIRRHEGSVSRALLIGPEGPDHTQKLPSDAERVLQHVSDLAAKDKAFAKTLPNMMESLKEIFDRLESAPVFVDVEGQKVGVSKKDLQGAIAMQIISIRNGAADLPKQVVDMNNGDFSEVARVLHDFRKTNGPESLMALAMDSASGISSQRQQQIALEAETCLLGEQMNASLVDIAKALGTEQLDNGFRGRLETELPILIVVGSLDYRTPVKNANELMQHMPNSNLVVVENCGHGDMPLGMPRLREIWGEFLRSGKGASETIKGIKIHFTAQNVENGSMDSASEAVVELPEGAIEMSPAQLASFEGDYRFERGDVVTVTAGKGYLVFRLPGGREFKLWPESEDKFFAEIKQIPNLTFVRNESGEVESMTGGGKVAKRLEE